MKFPHVLVWKCFHNIFNTFIYRRWKLISLLLNLEGVDKSLVLYINKKWGCAVLETASSKSRRLLDSSSLRSVGWQDKSLGAARRYLSSMFMLWLPFVAYCTFQQICQETLLKPWKQNVCMRWEPVIKEKPNEPPGYTCCTTRRGPWCKELRPLTNSRWEVSLEQNVAASPKFSDISHPRRDDCDLRESESEPIS